MSQQTDERAFEALVELTLLRESGWETAPNDEWDVERALFPARVCSFLEASQPKLWAKVRTLLGKDLEQQIVATLVKELKSKGTVHVLRHGFKFYGNLFRLATFRPAHGLNDEILSLYSLNRLTVSRQVPCHPAKQHTVDLLVALNGIPAATCELKNPSTGQNWQDAASQYKTDRDQNAPLFRFKARTLVHFAADPNEIHMTTDDVTPTVDRDGRFAKKPSETRPVGWAGHSPESRSRPGTVIMISAPWRTDADPARSAVADSRAGCATLCEVAVLWRTASWDHNSHWQGVAFGAGALAHDPDLGAPNPRKQSDPPQKKRSDRG